MSFYFKSSLALNIDMIDAYIMLKPERYENA